MGEITNPCNIMRKNLDYEGKKKLAKIASIVFAVVFMIMRVVVASLIVKPIMYSLLPILIKLAVGLMYFVGLYWSLMIFQLVLKEVSSVRFGDY